MKILHGIVVVVGICFGLVFAFQGEFISALGFFVSGCYAVRAYRESSINVEEQEPLDSKDCYADIRTWWQDHYRKQHGMELDLSQVLIPIKPDGNDWILLCIAQGLTPNKEFNSWTFPKWKAENNLDALVRKNARDTAETYFIWVRNGAEPDAEFLGQSTNQTDPDMKEGVTLLERLVLQSYTHRMGLVLDKKGITSCSGSRIFDGDVPDVRLGSDGKVSVGWCHADNCNLARGVRRAVALDH